MKIINDKKVDNSKVINTYRVDFNVKTFFNNKEIKNINKNNDNNIDDNNTIIQNKKNSLKRSVNINNNNHNNNIISTYAPHKTQIDISKKITNNHEIKLKLPNVIKKIGVQNVANRDGQKNKDIKDLKVYKEGNKNIYLSSSHISLINEKSDNKTNKNLSIKTKEQIEPEINKINQIGNRTRN